MASYLVAHCTPSHLCILDQVHLNLCNTVSRCVLTSRSNGVMTAVTRARMRRESLNGVMTSSCVVSEVLGVVTIVTLARLRREARSPYSCVVSCTLVQKQPC